ncbi:hypothetical protein [Burkholderia alba]|uniref:hypothetical protein n=1 Tax=Burkholderia alba TaxID=2683677 RepID=UPI002B05A2E8|nr:hypothetical protein [Burkholderia alba]
MKHLLASTCAVLVAAASTAATAQTSAGGDTPERQCAIGYVSGIGGSARSMNEYLALSDRDKYRYFADHSLQCQVSDEGRASNCTGLTNLRRERVSVYEDIDSTTMSVVARVELDRGTYPAIIVVRKQDVKCEE